MNIAKDVEQLKIIIYIPIWSYYYQVAKSKKKQHVIDLHSNMELLLLNDLALVSKVPSIFTFQYGATTMRPLLNSDFLIIYPLFLSISIFCKFYRYFQIKYLDLFNP